MRLVFFGSPVDAVAPLRSLVAAGHEVALVVTQPDRRRGRGAAMVPSAVKAAAIELGLPVATPQRAIEVLDDVVARRAEVGVVVAFGQLLPVRLLDAFPRGCVNVHFSLLPRWRGAAPVERAILAGDEETGVALMRMEAGLDTGPVYAEVRTPIGPDETAGELRARLGAIGTELLVRSLPRLAALEPTPQRGDACYAPKLEVEEFRLDPSRSAAELARLVRAGNPRPGAWARLDGRRLKVLRARAIDDAAPAGSEPGTLVLHPPALVTARGLLALDEVQPEGKRSMPGAAFLAGRRGPAALDPRPVP